MGKTILALAPHTDDVEFGLGGTVARLVGEGHTVHVHALSFCDDPSLIREFDESMAVLGVRGALTHEFPRRIMGGMRQAVLDLFIALDEQYQPDLVFCPNPYDVHQDHVTVANEALRAFKRRSIMGYELPWNSYQFYSNSYIMLQEVHIHKKIEALKCYKSQANRPYATPEFIRSQAHMRGVSIGVRYAECFQTIRQVI